MLLVALAACSDQDTDGASCDRNSAPTIGRTAEAVAVCLGPEGTAEQAAELLRGWGRMDDGYWGGVASADLLPGEGAELVLSYHADLPNVIWNPQGKLAILQSAADGWKVVFESPDPTEDTGNGADSLAGNWSFHVTAIGDLTGDQWDDLLVEQRYSNGTHVFLSYTKMLAAGTVAGERVRVVYLEDGSDTVPTYTIVDQTVQSVLRVNAAPAISRTFQLEGDAFALVKREINPEAAVKSAETADGVHWYAFDNPGSVYNNPRHGLYRWQDGELTHFEVPFAITCLQVLRDGQLYLGGNGSILRVEEDHLVALLVEEYALIETDSWGLPLEMALTAEGDLWVAAQYQLLRFGRDHSQAYDLLVYRVMLAADDTVWALGWDGIAESDCCFFRVQGDQVDQFGFGETLPVSPELASQIRAMRP